MIKTIVTVSVVDLRQMDPLFHAQLVPDHIVAYRLAQALIAEQGYTRMQSRIIDELCERLGLDIDARAKLMEDLAA